MPTSFEMHRRIRRATVIGMVVKTLVLVAALAGCKRPNQEGEVVEYLEGVTTSMCACTTKACVDKINNDLMEWAKELAKHAAPQSRPSDELTARVAETMEHYTSCMTKVLMAEPPAGQQ